MATIRKRTEKWHVQIRRKGSPSLTRSFLTKADAQAWARQIETEADRRGLAASRRVLDDVTVGDLLIRYRDEVSPTKKGAFRETMAIRVLLRHPLSKTPLSALTVAMVANHRDTRLRVIKPGSVNRELAIYRHALEVARHTWGYPIFENPFTLVKKPKVFNARSRRLEAGEWEKLRSACQQSRNPCILEMIEFGIETAMRRGEVLRARWRDFDQFKRTLHIPETKNGHARKIPLTSRALMILIIKKPSGLSSDDFIFQTTEDAVKMAWRRVVRRAGLSDFRYHDLRHEAISRFFEMGLSIPEVALISGHRDTRMLMRYTHLRPEDIANKLS